MDSILITSACFKLGFALFAVALLFATLRILDAMLGVKFGEIMAELRQSDGTATAVYFGCRILAVALLIGMALG